MECSEALLEFFRLRVPEARYYRLESTGLGKPPNMDLQRSLQ